MTGYNKWQSRRWWVCLWSMLMSTTIIAFGIYANEIPQGLGTALSLLVGIAGGYIAADSWTKPRSNPGEK